MKTAISLSEQERMLLEESLAEDYEAKVVQRGKRLFVDGRVQQIELKKTGRRQETHFMGFIQGDNDTYFVDLLIDLNGEFSEAICTCPYGFYCKHSAALLFALLAEQEGRIALGQEVNPDQWVQQFKKSMSPVQQTLSLQNWYLVYLIEWSDHDGIALAVVQRYRKQNGEWGRIQWLSPEAAADSFQLSVFDSELINLLYRIDGHYDYHGSAHREIFFADGVLGRQILEWAVRSGRALDKATMLPLQWGEDKALTFEWHSVKKGYTLAGQLNPPAESNWQIYSSLVPPVYRIDRTIGSANTPLNAAQLALVQQMPVLPEAIKNDVSVHLDYHASGASAEQSVTDAIPAFTDAIPVLWFVGLPSVNAGVLPAILLKVRYGDLLFPLGYDEALSREGNAVQEQLMETDNGYVRITRDWPAEAACVAQLRELDLVPYHYGSDIGERWVPSEVLPAKHVLAWNKLLPVLESQVLEQGWEIQIDPNYRIDQGIARLSGEATDAGQGWFDLKLNLHIDGAELDTETLLAQWLEAKTPDSMAVLGADNHWRTLDMQLLKPMLGLLGELYQGRRLGTTARLPTFKAAELDAIEDINALKAPALNKLRRELKNFKGVQTVKPAKYLNAELRDYQQQGLNWLMFLHRYGFGGILADDMGLGKTLQTLAFLQRLKAARKLQRGALIVAPTSLIWNWQKEAERFTPNLRCAVLHGTDRKALFDSLNDYDVVVTTYALIYRDHERYSQHTFNVCVLDEAQNIKNRHAKTTRRVKQLPADMRLCLTGTPLENHLGELWSLADYVLPGLLGDDKHFSAHFRQPIEQRGDSQRAFELSTRIAPFMLRRTKAEVASELPAKSTILQTVHLEGKQQALYESIRVSMEKRVRQLMKEKGLAKSRIEFLDALLKLRQACIDPRLVKLSKAEGIGESAKMAWLTDNLPEMVDEGRKVLLFSQFTSMLDLISAELKALGIETVKLTGRTRDREAAITSFQEGNVPVFLISLKAGGAGLNLTAADTVIHVDPWWNPAVENQATDRAYRIGQDKAVFVYKLVAAGTVEEKIQAMQREKQALADTLFEQSGQQGLPEAGDDLLALFASA